MCVHYICNIVAEETNEKIKNRNLFFKIDLVQMYMLKIERKKK